MYCYFYHQLDDGCVGYMTFLLQDVVNDTPVSVQFIAIKLSSSFFYCRCTIQDYMWVIICTADTLDVNTLNIVTSQGQA